MVEQVNSDGPAEAGTGDKTKKAVFYIYDEGMLEHRDHNYHTEEGKMKEGLDEASEENFISPEVPFRIKAIHDYLASNPNAESSYLDQMLKVEIDDTEWE